MRRYIKRQHLYDGPGNERLLGNSNIFSNSSKWLLRFFKWRDIHLSANHQSLQRRYGNDRERQWPLDMELYRIQWRYDGELFCKYPERRTDGIGREFWGRKFRCR